MNYMATVYICVALIFFINAYGMELEKTTAFLASGANVSSIGFFGITPLYYHCHRGTEKDIEIARTLLEKGEDPHKIPCFYPPLLTKAIDHENAPLVELLCKHVDINHKGVIIGRTPLIDAIRKRSAQIIGILLRNGADTNIPDALGSYPLHELLLCTHNNISQQKQNFPVLEILKMLLTHGADRTRQNEYKQTPLRLAQNLTCAPEIINLLISYGTIVQPPSLNRSQSSSKRKPLPTPLSVLEQKRRSIEVT
jgi:ankyrin repeat protein